MTMAIHEVTMPRALQNQTNGDLHADVLKDIGFNETMWATAADWFHVLKKEFEAARKKILNFTYGGGYRTWDEQYNLFLTRYEKISWATYLITPAARRKKWNAEVGVHKAKNPSTYYWRLKKIGTLPNGQPRYGAMAAVPGTSNHGWGLAVDLAIGLPAHAQGLDFEDRAWLEANVARFGFSYESTTEPWHIRYYVGDVCPPYINEKH